MRKKTPAIVRWRLTQGDLTRGGHGEFRHPKKKPAQWGKVTARVGRPKLWQPCPLDRQLPFLRVSTIQKMTRLQWRSIALQTRRTDPGNLRKPASLARTDTRPAQADTIKSGGTDERAA